MYGIPKLTQNIFSAIFIANVSYNQFLVQTLYLHYQNTFSKVIVRPFSVHFCFYKVLFHNKFIRFVFHQFQNFFTIFPMLYLVKEYHELCLKRVRLIKKVCLYVKNIHPNFKVLPLWLFFIVHNYKNLAS